MTRAIQKNTFLLFFFLCCSLPVLAAKLALELGWFTPGVTNKGQWFKTEIKILPDIKSTSRTNQRWHLVYVQTKECRQPCEIALYTLQQLYSGLAAHQERVEVSIIADQAPRQLTGFRDIAWQANGTSQSSLENKIVLVNPQGIALLHYPVANDSLAMMTIAKDIRTDLLRLLSFDRSGS